MAVPLVKPWLPKIRFTLRMEILPQDSNPGWNLVVTTCNVNYDSWQHEVEMFQFPGEEVDYSINQRDPLVTHRQYDAYSGMAKIRSERDSERIFQ